MNHVLVDFLLFRYIEIHINFICFIFKYDQSNLNENAD